MGKRRCGRLFFADNRLVKRIILCGVLTAHALANQMPAPARPACNIASRGRFWPDAANTNPMAAVKLAQCGSLEVCTAGAWKYRRRPVTVDVRQLGKNPQQPTAECIAATVEFGGGSIAK